MKATTATKTESRVRCEDLFEHQKCSRCNKTKPLSDYHRDPSRPTGFNGRCKQCISELRKLAYWKNPEKARTYSSAQAKKHYPRNKAKLIARVARWAKANPEKRRAQVQRWLARGGHDKKLEAQRRRRATGDYDARWRRRSKAARAVSNAKWYRSHRAEIAARIREKRDTPAHREYARKQSRRGYWADPAKARAKSRKESRRMVETLPLHYVKQLIKGKTRIPVKLIPDALALTWKSNIQLKRICQNQKTSTNSETSS